MLKRLPSLAFIIYPALELIFAFSSLLNVFIVIVIIIVKERIITEATKSQMAHYISYDIICVFFRFFFCIQFSVLFSYFTSFKLTLEQRKECFSYFAQKFSSNKHKYAIKMLKNLENKKFIIYI